MQIVRILDHSSVTALANDLRNCKEWLCFVQSPSSNPWPATPWRLIRSAERKGDTKIPRMEHSKPLPSDTEIILTIDDTNSVGNHPWTSVKDAFTDKINPPSANRVLECRLDPGRGLHIDKYAAFCEHERGFGPNDHRLFGQEVGFIAVVKPSEFLNYQAGDDLYKSQSFPFVPSDSVQALHDALLGDLLPMDEGKAQVKFCFTNGDDRGPLWTLLSICINRYDPELKNERAYIGIRLDGESFGRSLAMVLRKGLLYPTPSCCNHHPTPFATVLGKSWATAGIRILRFPPQGEVTDVANRDDDCDKTEIAKMANSSISSIGNLVDALRPYFGGAGTATQFRFVDEDGKKGRPWCVRHARLAGERLNLSIHPLALRATPGFTELEMRLVDGRLHYARTLQGSISTSGSIIAFPFDKGQLIVPEPAGTTCAEDNTPTSKQTVVTHDDDARRAVLTKEDTGDKGSHRSTDHFSDVTNDIGKTLDAVLVLDHSSPNVLVKSMSGLWDGSPSKTYEFCVPPDNRRFCFVSDNGKEGPAWRVLGIGVVEDTTPKSDCQVALRLLTDQGKTIHVQLMIGDDKLWYWCGNHTPAAFPNSNAYIVEPVSGGTTRLTRGVSQDDLKPLLSGDDRSSIVGRIKYMGRGDGFVDHSSAEALLADLGPGGVSDQRYCFANPDTGEEGSPWRFVKAMTTDNDCWDFCGDGKGNMLRLRILPDRKFLEFASALLGAHNRFPPAETVEVKMLVKDSKLWRCRDGDNVQLGDLVVSPRPSLGRIKRLGKGSTKPVPSSTVVSAIQESNERAATTHNTPDRPLCAICNSSLSREEEDGGNVCSRCTERTAASRSDAPLAHQGPQVRKPWPRSVKILALLAVMAVAYNADCVIEHAKEHAPAVRSWVQSVAPEVECEVCGVWKNRVILCWNCYGIARAPVEDTKHLIELLLKWAATPPDEVGRSPVPVP